MLKLTAPHICIGVDPGTTGALAFLEVDGEDLVNAHVLDYADHSTLDFLHCLSDELMFGLHTATAYVEEMGMRPGQDVRRTSHYVVHHGIVQGWLQACGIEYQIVNPRTWQAAIYRGLQPDRSAFCFTNVKSRHLDLARNRFAGFEGIGSCLKRVKDHNRADALLIAYYGFLALRSFKQHILSV